MRNTAISNSSRYRPSASGISSFTLTWLRSEKPLTYQRSAEARPTSSSMGGWRRYEIVRISRNASLVSRRYSVLNLTFGGDVLVGFLIYGVYIVTQKSVYASVYLYSLA